MDPDTAYLYREFLRARADASHDPHGPDAVGRFAAHLGFGDVDLEPARLADRLARELAVERAGGTLSMDEVVEAVRAKGVSDPFGEMALGPGTSIGPLVGAVLDYGVANDAILGVTLAYRRRQPDARWLVRGVGESDDQLAERAHQVILGDMRERDRGLGPIRGHGHPASGLRDLS
jgi:hypothetical protein